MAAQEWVVLSAFKDVGGEMVKPGAPNWAPATPESAEKLKKAGCITEKVASPFPGETMSEPSSSSPAGPAPAQLTLSSPASGPSLQSTTPGESPPGQKPSTPATEPGGTTTEKKSAGASQAKAGRKTSGRQKRTASGTSAAKSARGSANSPE